ncbi:hypothetical protein [Desulfogranum japonicum]|uniref:hypothetical protein n=1 Tax=Desulfogranum japonicum TaxID=231447 RepID=UPI00048C2401|nr:hypothetical protein [Desulfogranum japonicum]
MNKLTLFAGLLLIIISQTSALAEPGSVTVGAKGGTLGVGGEADIGLNDYLHLRGGVNLLKFSFDSTISNIDYEMEPEFKNASLLLDWYPFGGAFRLTGGLFLNDNNIDLTGTPRSDSEYWDAIPAGYEAYRSYADSIRVHGSVDFNTLAPYVGMGWNSNTEKKEGWGLAFEIGVLFQGSPSVSSLTVTADEPFDVLANHPEVQQFLKEEQQAIEDDLENFQYYPVASLTLSYTF